MVAALAAAGDDFRLALRALALTSGDLGEEDVPALLASIAPNTYKQYSSVWRRYVHAVRPAPPVPFTTARLLGYVRRIVRSSSRPGSSVAQLRTVVELFCSLAAGHISNPFTHNVALRRVVDGLVRTHTTRGRTLSPLLDIPKVLVYLQRQHQLDAAGRSVTTSSRDRALAAFAATIPSRPAELARLRLADLTLVAPVARVGRPDLVVRFPTLLTDQRFAELPSADQQFRVSCRLLDSKTDKRSKSGVDKLLQHVPGSEWSPALALVRLARHVAAGGSLPAHARDATTLGRHYIFYRTGAPGGLGARPLSPAGVSAILTRVALAAAGIPATGRAWRPAAATWLLRHGLDVETVAALGGWSTTDSLRRYYVRAAPLRDEAARAVIGLPPRAGSPNASPHSSSPAPAGPFAARPPLHRSSPLARASPSPPHRGSATPPEPSDSDSDSGTDDNRSPPRRRQQQRTRRLFAPGSPPPHAAPQPRAKRSTAGIPARRLEL